MSQTRTIPPCRSGKDCTRAGCFFGHPADRVAPATAAPAKEPPQCRYGKLCTRRADCTFGHPVDDATGTAAPAAPVVKPGGRVWSNWVPLTKTAPAGGGDYRREFECPFGDGCKAAPEGRCPFGGHSTPQQSPKKPCATGAECTYPGCIFLHTESAAHKLRGRGAGGGAPAPAGAGAPKEEDAAGCVFLPTATNIPAQRLAGAGGPSGGGRAAPAEDDDRIAAKLAKLNEEALLEELEQLKKEQEECKAIDAALVPEEAGEEWDPISALFADPGLKGWTYDPKTECFIPPLEWRAEAEASAEAEDEGGWPELRAEAAAFVPRARA